MYSDTLVQSRSAAQYTINSGYILMTARISYHTPFTKLFLIPNPNA